MNIRTAVVTIAVPLLMSGCATAPQEYTGVAVEAEQSEGAMAKSESDEYRFKVGDPVIVVIRGADFQVVEDVVGVDGNITLPYLHEVRALEMTATELERVISNRYVPTFYSRVSVKVLTPSMRSTVNRMVMDSQKSGINGDPLRQGDFWQPGEMRPWHEAIEK